MLCCFCWFRASSLHSPSWQLLRRAVGCLFWVRVSKIANDWLQHFLTRQIVGRWVGKGESHRIVVYRIPFLASVFTDHPLHCWMISLWAGRPTDSMAERVTAMCVQPVSLRCRLCHHFWKHIAIKYLHSFLKGGQDEKATSAILPEQEKGTWLAPGQWSEPQFAILWHPVITFWLKLPLTLMNFSLKIPGKEVLCPNVIDSEMETPRGEIPLPGSERALPQ